MNSFLALRRSVGAVAIAAALAVVTAVTACTNQPGHSRPAADRSSTVTCQQIVTGTRQLTLRRVVARSAFTPSFTWPAVLRSRNARMRGRSPGPCVRCRSCQPVFRSPLPAIS